MPETVVCIGVSHCHFLNNSRLLLDQLTLTLDCMQCDGHYGPSRRMLETAFARPFALFIEFPFDYVHNAPFRRMAGNQLGERLVFQRQLVVNSSATPYTRRTLRAIEYSP